MRRIPLIIDTDPGIDDAVAISFAMFHPEIDLRLITTVAGNVSIDKTTDNALKLVEFFDVDIPVARGCSEPLLKPLEDSSEIHGESGMGGFHFEKPSRTVLPVHAVEALREELVKSEEPVTLMPIAALTNIALLFKLYPETKEKVKEIVLMGGSLSRGNTTTAAEFNIFTDPEAAAIIFESGVKLTMIGLDVTSRAVLMQKEVKQIETMNRAGEMFAALFSHYRGGSMKTGLKMHDVCALAAIVQPELFDFADTHVEIETGKGPANGATVADLKMKYHTETNATVALDVHVEKFREWFLEMLEQTK
ncbi:ribonucleoside hydrolase RihC [Listeria aquatica]|uniref:ribonucleoside hydrolase RihC n=1 Tax=Listeria aquatica TaxID=1494960 RepID=UPI003EF27562